MNIIEGDSNRSSEEFYTSLKEKLEATHDFPEDYLFKFIIPNDQAKLTEIYRVFDGIKHTLTNKDSKNGKYTALTFNAFVLDADHVIRIYKAIGNIEGAISL